MYRLKADFLNCKRFLWGLLTAYAGLLSPRLLCVLLLRPKPFISTFFLYNFSKTSYIIEAGASTQVNYFILGCLFKILLTVEYVFQRISLLKWNKNVSSLFVCLLRARQPVLQLSSQKILISPGMVFGYIVNEYHLETRKYWISIYKSNDGHENERGGGGDHPPLKSLRSLNLKENHIN